MFKVQVSKRKVAIPGPKPALVSRGDFPFDRTMPERREAEAFQVERAAFDHLLLKHARSAGAEVREGWTVTKFSSDADGVTIRAASDAGVAASFRGAFLIDASGRGNLTGNQEGLREIH